MAGVRSLSEPRRGGIVTLGDDADRRCDGGSSFGPLLAGRTP